MPESPTSGNLRIIVLDDEPLVLSSMTMLLESLGHDVLPASHGEAVLEVVRQGQTCDVAILDLIVHRGLGGQDIAATLRAESPETKLVVSTGYGMDAVVEDLHSVEFDDRLPKPFSMADLQSLFERLAKRE